MNRRLTHHLPQDLSQLVLSRRETSTLVTLSAGLALLHDAIILHIMQDYISCRMSTDPRVYVWVAGVGSRRGADGVLRRLMDNAGLEPSNVLPVNGRTPGVILQFSSLAQVRMRLHNRNCCSCSNAKPPEKGMLT